MRKNILVSIFCFCILALAAIKATAADYIVTTSQDRDGTCLSNNNCSLREAVKAANAAGGQNNIYFPQFLDGQIFDLTLGELGFHNGTLNIQGSSPYFVHIRGAGSRIFAVVNGARLELRGLKLTNGNGGGALYNGLGGAILVEDNRNCRLLLDGVMVSGNSASSGGGAISAQVATTTITNSIISGNTSTSFGGGLLISGTVTVENSSIVNNRSLNSFGGGAYFGGGVIGVRNVTISDNRANDAGGIYYNPFTGADRLNLEYVTVSYNRSDDSRSGGLHCFGTGASAQMSIFYGNTNRLGSGTNPNVDSFCALNATNHIGPNSPNPNFGPLTFDGVHPHYRPLLPGSGAIDAGAATGFPAADIRGAGRATDGNGDGQFISDLGAYEAPSMVTNTSNDATTGGSLRRMIAGNPANSEIIFDPNFFNVPRTIQVSGSLLSIDKNLTISGPGAGLLTIQQQTQSSAIFVSPATALYLYDIKIAGGSNRPIYNGGTFITGGVTISGSQAGAMYSAPGTTTVLWYSTISGNTSNVGGGIFNDGALYLVHSTISGNNSTGIGGGVYNNGLAYFVNSTVSGNTSSEKGAGLYNAANANARFINSTVTNNRSFSFAGAGVWNENFSAGNTVRARNSIIAANISGNGNPVDYLGDLNNLGNNIVNNSNPGLAPLGFYGGITEIHPILPDSPALNAGSNCVLTANGCGDGELALSYDQRGGSAPRRIGAAVDIGAFERSVALDQTSLPNAETTINYSQQLSATRQTSLTEFLPVMSDENFFETSLAPFTFSVVPIAGQSLPPGLTLASNGALSGTPTQAGTFTFTVKAADTDGISGVARYSVTIAAFNNPPTVSGATITRQAGSPVSNSQIATVGDAENGAGSVSVSVTSANPSNGVTVSNVVNTNGNVASNVIAACSAGSAAFTVRASDGSKTTNGTLTVNVSANTAPTLVYPASQTVLVNNSVNISPTTAQDNGSIASFAILSVSPAMPTAPTINASGVVSITNANPGGTYTITVRATDNCGATRDASFTLNVTIPNKTVTKIEDTNDGVCDADCSLREAINAAVSGDTILFAAPLFDTAQIITLGSELNVAGKTITITGRAVNLTTVSGNDQSRVFSIAGGANLTLGGLTVTGGRDVSTGGGIYNAGTLQITNCAISGNSIVGSGNSFGGGIYNADFATATITRSTIANNSVSGSDNFGGGVYNGTFSTMTIDQSTISGNSVSDNGNFSNRGGGIGNDNGILTIRNSTVSGNSASGGTNNRGGGIYSQYRDLTIVGVTVTGNSAGSSGYSYGGGIFTSQDTVILANTIISGNSAPSNPNLFGSLNTSNFNLIDGDARLAPLGNYGGATQTHALLPDSPALNTGNPSPQGTIDQRGSARVVGSRSDIGAFEASVFFDQTALPNGNYGINYNQQFSANRQTALSEDVLAPEALNIAPTSFALVPGQNLPPGLDLSSTGLLSGTPTMPGVYTFTVKATDTDAIAGVSQYTLNILAPTAAAVEVSGKVLTAGGGGIRNVVVTLTDSSGNTRTALTTTFGNFRFTGVAAGEIYVIGVVSKKFTFEQPTQVLSVSEDVAGLLFTAQE